MPQFRVQYADAFDQLQTVTVEAEDSAAASQGLPEGSTLLFVKYLDPDAEAVIHDQRVPKLRTN